MKTLFSGIQPSGNLHIGNYLGAIRQWLDLQDKYNSIFSVVDLHAITVQQDPKDLNKKIREIAAIYIASGINPDKVILFQQSKISEHTELAWVLNTITPLGLLERMTQFKDKSKKYGTERTGAGLLNYPILMAADILLYNADIVPVGSDQKQHVEFTRDLAEIFNKRYNKNFFVIPKPLIEGKTTRVMSLKDGTKKMSKSDNDLNSCIYLTDDRDLIKSKIKKAKTDSIIEFSYDKENRPELANLLNIYSDLSGLEIQKIIDMYNGKGFGKFKEELAEVIIEKICPIGDKIKDLMSNVDYINKILEKGNDKAKIIASNNFKEVKEIIGIN